MVDDPIAQLIAQWQEYNNSTEGAVFYERCAAELSARWEGMKKDDHSRQSSPCPDTPTGSPRSPRQERRRAMSKKTWWAVISHSGQYDDYRACAVVVYPDPVAANEHANAAAAWARRWWEKHRDDFETADWENPSTTLSEPKSPFDRYLGRSEASDVTYGVREMEVRSSVPKAGRRKSS